MIRTELIHSINKLCRNKNIFLNNTFSPTYSVTLAGSLNFTLQRHRFYSSSSSGPGQDNFNWRQRVVGAQTGNRLNVGPYKRGRWFVSYKEDPGSFITNILIILVTGYAIFTLLPGESMKVRRQRKLRQMLLDKANMTESELSYIENYKLETVDEQSAE
ncbi:hypothetical protein MACK_003062 [Theileria orientalis]|uniref:Transmembrane protein n=1 Tax=Theileria orientalis TaxID=68886 RepID=A0A976MFF6_THEOR|nr:hypothetical protein MACK_003062 [Theileria orientalis]